jgi:fumarate hydratase class I
MARLIEKHGVRVILGKGGMGEATRRACAEHGCVYLHAVGGAASVIADRITAVVSVHFFNEFGPAEAMWELTVDGLEAIVTIDARGRSIHDRIRASSKRALGKLLAQSRTIAV